jgi:hypothetical protein
MFRRFLLALGVIYLLPLLIAICMQLSKGPQEHWSRADRSSAGIAPDPARTPEALVQVYAARTWLARTGLHMVCAEARAGNRLERFHGRLA